MQTQHLRLALLISCLQRYLLSIFFVSSMVFSVAGAVATVELNNYLSTRILGSHYINSESHTTQRLKTFLVLETTEMEAFALKLPILTSILAIAMFFIIRVDRDRIIRQEVEP